MDWIVVVPLTRVSQSSCRCTASGSSGPCRRHCCSCARRASGSTVDGQRATDQPLRRFHIDVATWK